MRDWDFFLVPFAPSTRDVRLSLKVSLDREVLRLKYRVSGSEVGLVKTVEGPGGARRDELWTTTCFELFIGRPGRADYVELNMSANTDWNAYAFDRYREGMKRAASVKRSPVDGFRSTDTGLELSATVRLQDLAMSSPVELGATAVLEYVDGTKEYWALSHRGEKPDFHLRSSFTAQVRE